MDNFDLKKFLIENKLTENSRLGEIKAVPGNTGIKDKGKLKIGDTITPEMWDKQKIETHADAEELIPYDEIIQDSYLIKNMQFDEGDAETEADWMVDLRDKNGRNWGITGTPEELSFLNNLLKDKYIIVSPDNLKEIKAVPGNTGIKNTLTFTFEEAKGKMVFIEIDEDGDDSKEYMQINTLDDYNRLKNVIADYSKSGILVDYYPY
jgi:hypothetical protein